MAKAITIPTEKINIYFNKAVDFIQSFPSIFKSAPIDEKVAYISVAVGFLFIIIGLIL